MVSAKEIPGTSSTSGVSTEVGGYDEESEWLQRAIAGHRPSFDRIVQLYHGPVYRVAFRFFNNPEDALDATQEIFLRAWRAIKGFEGRSSLKTWLFRIASNTCTTLAQERARRQKSFLQAVLDWFSLSPAPDPGQSVVEQEHRQELQRIVQEKVAKLPEVYRMPVILRDLEGMSLEAIGEVLNLKEGTVKSRINRGRRLLQESLEPFVQGRMQV